MRITSVMVGKAYQRNLNKAQQLLNKADETATNFRKFQSVSDDPSGATKAFQLRREYTRAEAYQRNAEEVDGRMKTAESGMINVQEMLKDAKDKLLQGNTGSLDADGRAVIAEELRGIQKAIIQDMNISYTGQYLFGGASTNVPPLTVGEDGKLLYRGQPVEFSAVPPETTAVLPEGIATEQEIVDYNASMKAWEEDQALTVPTGVPKPDLPGVKKNDITAYNAAMVQYDVDMQAWEADQALTPPTGVPKPTEPATPGNIAKEKIVKYNADMVDWTNDTTIPKPSEPEVPGTVSEQQVATYNAAVELDSANKAEYDKELKDYNKTMANLSGEQVLVDFGFGIDPGNSQSGFDISLSALNLLGFGKAENGMPNNLYNLVGEMADILEKSGDSFDPNAFGVYIEQFEESHDQFLTGITNMGSKSQTISYTLTRLDSSIAALQEKQNYVEFVDPTQALSDWKWQEFAYRSALAIGTKILQPSLLDYLN